MATDNAVRQGSLARRLVRNALSLLTSDVLNRATSFIIYALVARQLGAAAFGQVSLAFTLFYVFQVLAVAGLKTLITREVARDREHTQQYLVNATVVVVAYALFSMVVLAAFVKLMGYSADTAVVILLLSIGLIPYAMTAVCEAIFQAWERMHYIAWANAPLNVVKVGVVFAVLLLGFGVRELMIVIVVSLTSIAIFEWWLIVRNIVVPRGGIDLAFAWAISKRATTFLGIDVLIAVWAAVPVVLLSKFATEREVGLFSAAQQLLVPFSLVYQAMALSVFPLLCRKFASGIGELRTAGTALLEALMILALPTAVGLFMLADASLLLLYRDTDFLNSVTVLRILVWLTVLRAITTGLGQLLFAANQERMTLRIVATNAAVVLTLGIVLVKTFGLTGAAVATAAAGLVNAVLHFASVWKVLPGFWFNRRIWIPLGASAIMAAYLQLVQWDHLLFLVASGAIVYALALIIGLAVSDGGPKQLKARYLRLWSSDGHAPETT